ncbi:putative Trypsin-4 [Hypsibius exemplaris]|uniref:Trypsin-4 n=1 Tax=Hypsibius exemplaris TaxID=2072580 RepID=A0A9X6NE02_HYPEX|nr:putative Trypsin-4 [Hypsibius exemplaris]
MDGNPATSHCIQYNYILHTNLQPLYLRILVQQGPLHFPPHLPGHRGTPDRHGTCFLRSAALHHPYSDELFPHSIVRHSRVILHNLSVNPSKRCDNLDRWLFVEFAIKYRTTITKRKALKAGIISTFVVPAGISVSKYIVYWKDITVDRCSGNKHFAPAGVGAEISEMLMGTVFLQMLFISQLRVLMIAAKQRLRQIRRTVAAHCRKAFSDSPVASSFRVRVESQTLQDVHVQTISRLVIHPKYTDSPAPIDDFCMLKTSQAARATATLRQVDVVITDQAKCSRAYSNTITPVMVCAESVGKDSCQGDSGGPFVCADKNGVYKLVGVVSFGNGCAKQGFPGIYARTTSALDFISSTLKE